MGLGRFSSCFYHSLTKKKLGTLFLNIIGNFDFSLDFEFNPSIWAITSFKAQLSLKIEPLSISENDVYDKRNSEKWCMMF